MSREQGLRRTGCRQIERYEIWVGISRLVEIDRRFHPNPFGLRHWWIGAQQIIESQAGPPRNSAPALHTDQPRNLLVHLEAREQVADIQRNSKAGSETVELQFPFGDVTGIRSCAVVIVLEWRDLRFRVGGDQAIFRIERLCNIVVDAQGSVEKPLLFGPGLV